MLYPSMETAIIGLPLAGKTTIFNALTGQQAHLSSATGGKKQLNLAEVEVPDGRVEELARLLKPKKKVHATVLFKDAQSEFRPEGGFAPATLVEVRTSEAIALVLRAFRGESVFPPSETMDPVRDLGKVLDSLIFSDFEMADKRMDRLDKEGKRSSREYQLLERLAKKLERGSLLGRDFLSPDEEKLLSGFRFLTVKPILVIADTEAALAASQGELNRLEQEVKEWGLELFTIQGDLEMEIAQLPEGEQREFLEDLGLAEPAKNRFLRRLYESLDLISFLTTSGDEVRAWSIPSGTPAVRAAGKIHTDLEKGFIRAEVIQWQELIEAEGYAGAKKQGKLRLEGRDYLVQDGDVVTVRFNI